MKLRVGHHLCLAIGIAPMYMLSAQATPPVPTCEQVFKDIRSFKGVPASDLIPAMEFMTASLGYKCSSCHDPKNYAAETEGKGAARNMITLQRDINTRFFRDRLQVTCMSCHNGKSHPTSAPIPEGVTMRHDRLTNAPKVDEVFAKHIASVGKPMAALARTGTLTAPSDETHEIEKKPLEFLQAEGGKFRLVSGDRKVGSDGAQVWYGANPMGDEPANIFGRIGRAWRGDQAFAGLDKMSIGGQDKIGKTSVIIVRGTRASTGSSEELYFDAKSGLLLRLVNVKRSTLGAVVSSIDYANYKSVNGMKVPMKVTATFAGNEQWIMDFKSAKADSKVNDADYAINSGGK